MPGVRGWVWMRDSTRSSVRRTRLPVAAALFGAVVMFLLLFSVSFWVVVVVCASLGLTGENFVSIVAIMAAAWVAFSGSGSVYRHFRWRLVEEDGVNCARCDYSLTGLSDPRCPECGQPFEAKGDAP